MSSFTLVLNFEGLLHYVLNDDTTRAGRICIVLPKAAQHTGSIYALNGAIDGTDPGGVALDGYKVVIKFTPNTSDFDFETPVIGSTRRLKGAIPLEGLIGQSADKNLDIVAPVPPQLTVRSQVLVGTGGKFILNNNDPNPPGLMLPPNSLNSWTTTNIDFGEFYMEALNVDQAWLTLFSLTSPSTNPVATYLIVPDSNRTASLVISHTCAGTTNRNPPIPDDDFRYHYMLLTSLPSGVQLSGMPVPIINKFSGASHNFLPPSSAIIKPDGCDCAGARATDRTFNLDDFMNASVPPSVSSGQPTTKNS